MIICALDPTSISYGILFFSVSTLNIYIKEYTDDTYYSEFKTLLAIIRPVEIVYKKENINKKQLDILKNMNISPVFSPIYKKTKISATVGVTAIIDYFGLLELDWPQALQTSKFQEWDNVFGAFAVADTFLSETLLATQV